jgi:hypothetical protein
MDAGGKEAFTKLRHKHEARRASLQGKFEVRILAVDGCEQALEAQGCMMQVGRKLCSAIT